MSLTNLVWMPGPSVAKHVFRRHVISFSRVTSMFRLYS